MSAPSPTMKTIAEIIGPAPDAVQGQISGVEAVKSAVVFAVGSGLVFTILAALQSFASWINDHPTGMPGWLTGIAALIIAIYPTVINLLHQLIDGKPAPPK